MSYRHVNKFECASRPEPTTYPSNLHAKAKAQIAKVASPHKERMQASSDSAAQAAQS